MKSPTRIALAFAIVMTAAAAGSAAAAQLYRWVDEQGRVEWRDTPPPPEAKNVEKRTFGGNTIETSTLPYDVQQAVKKHPVTLWAFDCGELCTLARNHLAKRGIPHTERNAMKERAALIKATGSNDVPVLVVGTTILKGYLDTDWDAALDAAGYPASRPPGMKPPVSKPEPPAAPANSQAQKAAAPQGGGAAAKGGGAPKAEKPAARQP